MKLLLSPEAEQDLLDIWLYIAEDNPINADRFLDKLQEKAQSLVDAPKIGTLRPEIKDGIRLFPIDNYNLYYMIGVRTIELVRVLHCSRDIYRLFD